MKKLFGKVGSDQKGEPTDPEAIRLEIQAEIDQWRPEEGGGSTPTTTCIAHDREEMRAGRRGRRRTAASTRTTRTIENGKIRVQRHRPRRSSSATCSATRSSAYKGLVDTDPTFKVPDDHQIGFEPIEPQPDAKDQRTYWRTYYLERAVRLTGSAISNAMRQLRSEHEPPDRAARLQPLRRPRVRRRDRRRSSARSSRRSSTTRSRARRSSTARSAAVARRSRWAAATPTRQERERDELVTVLKTGSLPAPLREESAVRASVRRSAATRSTRRKLSFTIGIVLVVLIMVGIYRWSGWIAVFAVVFHIVMTLAVMALFGATLTLPGIAAIVLSIGMEVDGNILIYERIRDELLLGKSRARRDRPRVLARVLARSSTVSSPPPPPAGCSCSTAPARSRASP